MDPELQYIKRNQIYTPCNFLTIHNYLSIMFWNINLFPKLSTEEPNDGFANYPTGASKKLNQIADCYVQSRAISNNIFEAMFNIEYIYIFLFHAQSTCQGRRNSFSSRS